MVVRILRAEEAALLDRVAPGVFDHAIDPKWTAEFFADPRHHLAVAIEGDRIVGMASGVHYVHPDKAPELWINEVGVARTHHGAGIGTRLVETLCAHGWTLGCREAWVLTERENAGAMRMYVKAGGVEQPRPSIMFTFRSEPDRSE